MPARPQSWEKWYWRDWLLDPAVQQLDPAAKGLWVDMLGAMWSDDTDRVEGTIEQLARRFRAPAETVAQAVHNLWITSTAEVRCHALVTRCHAMSQNVTLDVTDHVTVICRRRQRELSHRKDARNRKRRQREREASRDGHPPCPPIESESESDLYKTPSLQDLEGEGMHEQKARSRLTPRPASPDEVRCALSVLTEAAPDLVGEERRAYVLASWQRFLAHWAGEPGPKGERADWGKTWENWIRHDVTRFHPPKKAPPVRELTWGWLRKMGPAAVVALAQELGVSTRGKPDAVLFPELIEASKRAKP